MTSTTSPERGFAGVAALLFAASVAGTIVRVTGTVVVVAGLLMIARCAGHG